GIRRATGSTRCFGRPTSSALCPSTIPTPTARLCCKASTCRKTSCRGFITAMPSACSGSASAATRRKETHKPNLATRNGRGRHNHARSPRFSKEYGPGRRPGAVCHLLARACAVRRGRAVVAGGQPLRRFGGRGVVAGRGEFGRGEMARRSVTAAHVDELGLLLAAHRFGERAARMEAAARRRI